MSIWSDNGTDKPFNTNEMATPIVSDVTTYDWGRRGTTVDCSINNTDITITLTQMKANNNAGRIAFTRLDNTNKNVYIKPFTGQYLDGVIDKIIQLYPGQTIVIFSEENKAISPPGGRIEARSFLRPIMNTNGAIRSLITPTNASDLTNKQYVDNAISSSIAGSTEWRGNWFTNAFPTDGGSGVSGAIRAGDYWDVTEILTITDINAVTKVIYPPNQLRAVSDSATNEWTQWLIGNDALLRSAGDYAIFLNKTIPIGADSLLSEDSADLNNKKKITLASLPISTATQTELDKKAYRDVLAVDGNILIEDAQGNPVNSNKKFGNDGTIGTVPTSNDLANAINTLGQGYQLVNNSPNGTMVIATSNIALSSASTYVIESRTLIANDCVTLTNQTLAKQNGYYRVTGIAGAWALSRIYAPTDYTTWNNLVNTVAFSTVSNPVLQVRCTISLNNGTVDVDPITFTTSNVKSTPDKFNFYVSSGGSALNTGQTQDNPVNTIANVFTKTPAYPLNISLAAAGSAYACPTSFANNNVLIEGKGLKSGQQVSLSGTTFTTGILNNQSFKNVIIPFPITWAGGQGHNIEACTAGSSASALITTTAGFANKYGYMTDTDISSSLATWNLDFSLGSGTIYMSNVAQARIKFGTNANIRVFLSNCPSVIFDNGGLGNIFYTDTDNIIVNAIIPDQATLTALLSDTNVITDGYYICQFASPSIGAIGDILLKQSVQSVITNIKVHRPYSQAGASVSVISSSTQQTYGKSGNGAWIQMGSGGGGFTAIEDSATTTIDFNTLTTTAATHYVNASITLSNVPAWLTSPYTGKDLELFTLATSNMISQRIIAGNIQGFREAIKISGSYVWNNWQQLAAKDTVLQSLVIDGLQTPPSTPNDSDSYVVLASPTGAWSGFTQGWIATYNQATTSWAQASPVGKTITLQDPVNLQSINSYYFAGGSFKYAPTWGSPVITGLFWQLYVPNTQFQPYASHSVSLVRASNVVTATDTVGNHNLAVGYSFTISSSVNASFNGTFTVLSIINSTQFTYAQTGTNASTTGTLNALIQLMGSGFTSAIFPASLTAATTITVTAGSYSAVTTFPVYNNSSYVCNAFGISIAIGQNNILFTSTNTGWSPVTPSAGTGISDGNLYGYNYGLNANGDFANGLTGYQVGSVTMSGINPTTGFTPGTSTLIIGLTTDTDANTVMKITSAGNVAAGQSIKFPTVNVPNEYKGIVLTLEQLFRINGLTNIVTQGGLTDSFSLWGYDVTNNAIIPFAQTGFIYAGAGNNTLNARQTLVIPPTCNQFYLMLIVSNAITGAMTNGLLIGKTKIRDIPVSNGVPVTNWASTTISITADTTAPTLGTTPVKNTVIQRRNGQNLELIWDYCSNSGSTGEAAGNGSYIINLPKPLDLATFGIVGVGAGGSNYIGTASFTNGINTTSVGWVEAISATQARVYFTPQGGANVGAFWGSTYQAFGNASYRLGFTIAMNYPVSGWSSNVAMSSNAPSGQVVAMGAPNTAGFAAGGTLTFNYNVLKGGISVSLLSGRQIVTVPYTGSYSITGSTQSGSFQFNLLSYVNGGYATYLTTVDGSPRNFCATLDLTAGSYFEIRSDGAGSQTGNGGIQITYIGQNQTIATEPPISIDLTSTNNPTLLTNPIANASQIVIFNNAKIQGNIAYNTTTGIGTILTNGRYNFNHFIEINANSSDYITALNLTISGTLYTLVTAHMAQNYNVSINQSLAGSISRYMSAGDTFTFQARPGSASTTVTAISRAEVTRISS